MSSYTTSDSYSFTITHARHLASKVATDLKRIQRFYSSSLTDNQIAIYEQELIAFLKAGFLRRVIYGFKKDGEWIKPTLQYTAKELADSYYAIDDDPGKIRPGQDVSGAHFASFLVWDYGNASEAEKEAFKQELPFDRSIGAEPSANGHWQSDLAYTSGSRSLNRSHLT
tara:strand:- start:16315 stop:16821 length:507 start_codon:yes stop_codon:yes gene_type:complete